MKKSFNTLASEEELKCTLANAHTHNNDLSLVFKSFNVLQIRCSTAITTWTIDFSIPGKLLVIKETGILDILTSIALIIINLIAIWLLFIVDRQFTFTKVLALITFIALSTFPALYTRIISPLHKIKKLFKDKIF